MEGVYEVSDRINALLKEIGEYRYKETVNNASAKVDLVKDDFKGMQSGEDWQDTLFASDKRNWGKMSSFLP